MTYERIGFNYPSLVEYSLCIFIRWKWFLLATQLNCGCTRRQVRMKARWIDVGYYIIDMRIYVWTYSENTILCLQVKIIFPTNCDFLEINQALSDFMNTWKWPTYIFIAINIIFTVCEYHVCPTRMLHSASGTIRCQRWEKYPTCFFSSIFVLILLNALATVIAQYSSTISCHHHNCNSFYFRAHRGEIFDLDFLSISFNLFCYQYFRMLFFFHVRVVLYLLS